MHERKEEYSTNTFRLGIKIKSFNGYKADIIIYNVIMVLKTTKTSPVCSLPVYR